MPKISIIIPVYNTEKYLDKCIQSVINQTFKDIEVIIIDDGSTDNSKKIIDEYAKKYPEKIRSFSKENGGLSSARNYGIEKAKGEYISFVDSDDYIQENLFENLQKEIDKKIDLIKFKMNLVNYKYEKTEKIKGPIFEEKNGEEAFNTLVFWDLYMEPACLYLYKKELFDENFKFSLDKYNEDFGLIPLIILKSRKVSSVDIYGYNYLQTDNSITRNNNYSKTLKSAKDLLFHYDNMIKKQSKLKLNKKTEENLKLYYTNSILSRLRKLEKKDRKEYKKEIKKRNLVKNIKVKNVKSFIKKIYYSFM